MPDRYGESDPVDDVLWDAEQRRQRAIAQCEWCNADGVRGDLSRCDHRDYAAIAARGLAKVKAILEGKQR